MFLLLMSGCTADGSHRRMCPRRMAESRGIKAPKYMAVPAHAGMRFQSSVWEIDARRSRLNHEVEGPSKLQVLQTWPHALEWSFTCTQARDGHMRVKRSCCCL